MQLVSIIIPCRNENRNISIILDNILQNKLNGIKIEVIVVDGMSEDGTRQIINEYKKHDQRIILIDNHKKTTPHALNLGIQRSKGKIIIRMDAHAEYAQDYIYNCIKCMQMTGAENVGGPVRIKARTYMQNAIGIAFNSWLSVGGAKFHNPNYEGWVDTVTYGCYRKSKLIEIGLFDEKLIRNQDDELNYRIIRSGGKIWQSPKIKLWYYPRENLISLFNQYFQYGYWKVKVIQKHKIPSSIRQLVPIFFIGFIFIGAFAVIYDYSLYLPYLIIWALYFLLILSFSIMTSIRKGLRYFPILPAIYFTYHLSYGIGFLFGLINLSFLRKTREE